MLVLRYSSPCNKVTQDLFTAYIYRILLCVHWETWSDEPILTFSDTQYYVEHQLFDAVQLRALTRADGTEVDLLPPYASHILR